MFDPELVVYNAGTDVLDGDPLGEIKVNLVVGYWNYMKQIYWAQSVGSVWDSEVYHLTVHHRVVLNVHFQDIILFPI